MRMKKNDRYLSIAIYAFLVVAATMLAVVIGIRLPGIFAEISRFFDVIWSFFIGLIIAYICNPLVRFAESFILPKLKRRSRRLARLLALCFTYLVVLLIIAVLLFMIVPQIILNYHDFSSHVIEYMEILLGWISSWVQSSDFFGSYDSLASLFETEAIAAAFAEWITSFAGRLASLGLQMLEAVGNLLLGCFLSAHILFYKEYIAATCKKLSLALLPKRAFRAISDTISFADRAFGQFIVGKLFDSLIVGIIAFVVLAIVNMPYYPLISAIVCITNIIPAFGPFIGMVPCFLIILVQDPIMALWFLVIAIAIQQLDGNLIGPKIIGSVTGLAPVWVIVAIMLMGAYFGPIGWFIGVPLFSVIYRVIGDLANRTLSKKSCPTSLDYYKTTTLAEVTTHVPAADGKEEHDEEVDE